MALEKTLVMIKPDGVLMDMVDDIIHRYEAAGFGVVEQYPVEFSLEQAAEFYQDHVGKFYFTGLKLSLSSGPCLVLILEGEEAITNVRALNGATIPSEAEPGTIRSDFRSAGGPFNTVHASDSFESFEREYTFVLRNLINRNRY